MLPQLRKIEERHPTDIAVVGVHSGKFTAERQPDRIRDASNRLEALHPIVNDRQFRIWRSFAVQAWPTLVIVDPQGYVISTHAGEFTAEMLEPVIERTRAALAASGGAAGASVHFAPDAPTIAPTVLRFPGKVAVDDRRIAISDSGNHRILIGTLTDDRLGARISRVVGRSGTPGFVDGTDPEFDAPQGLCFSGDTLYVADSENHAVRAIALGSGFTRTIAGTGQQLRTAADLRAGALSSPWDVAVAEGRLFIAMAGNHQLWSVGFGGEGLRRHSGSLREDIVDGPNAAAALAQPMGLAGGVGPLYFVDAESSAVRQADPNPSGRIVTIVGTGLFDFGDRDGAGEDVLLQHPQAVARAADGRLLVADSYNDALKWVDPATRSASTLVRGLHEPSGLALAARRAYVADTNAHRIAVVDLAGGRTVSLEVEVLAQR